MVQSDLQILLYECIGQYFKKKAISYLWFDIVIMFFLQNVNFSQPPVSLALRLMIEVAESSPKVGGVDVIMMRYLERSGEGVSQLPYVELALST